MWHIHFLAAFNADSKPVSPLFHLFNAWLCRTTFNKEYKGFESANIYMLAKFKHVKKILIGWITAERLKENGNLA